MGKVRKNDLGAKSGMVCGQRRASSGCLMGWAILSWSSRAKLSPLRKITYENVSVVVKRMILGMDERVRVVEGFGVKMER